MLRVAERRHFCIGREMNVSEIGLVGTWIEWEMPLLRSSDAFGACYLGFAPQAINWHRIRDSIAVISCQLFGGNANFRFRILDCYELAAGGKGPG